MIPEAAVEAAACAVARNYGSAGTPNNTVLWTRLVSDIQTALEAAAPHLMAQAWDACVASLEYPDGSKVEVASNTNPYR